MTLNSSGVISLAGNTPGTSIEQELGSVLGTYSSPYTSSISLLNSDVETLAGNPSPVIMPNSFWGKSAGIRYSLTVGEYDLAPTAYREFGFTNTPSLRGTISPTTYKLGIIFNLFDFYLGTTYQSTEFQLTGLSSNPLQTYFAEIVYNGIKLLSSSASYSYSSPNAAWTWNTGPLGFNSKVNSTVTVIIG